MNKFLLPILCFSFCLSILNAQDLVIPHKIEEEIYIKLKRFEGTIDNNQNIENILKYDHRYVEEIIFKHMNDSEIKNLNYLVQIIKILGHFETHRAILSLSKFAEPIIISKDPGKTVIRPRHIRLSAINALMQKINDERANYVIKYIGDNDPIFQCLVLKLLTEKRIKEAIQPTYEIFKKSNTDELFKVKIDAASLIITVTKDPQMKNSVILNMLIDPNIHIRKAGLTLLSDGGEAGDAEVRRKLKELIINAKDEELELACKGAGIIKANETKEELLIILNRENSPLIKWECLNSLFKMNYDKIELNKKINELIETYKNNESIKNADHERFKRLLEFVNLPKESK